MILISENKQKSIRRQSTLAFHVFLAAGISFHEILPVVNKYSFI